MKELQEYCYPDEGKYDEITCKEIIKEYFKRGVVDPDLNACLMCGSNNVFLKKFSDEGFGFWHIFCSDCGLRTGVRLNFEKDDLVRDWNNPNRNKG